MVLAYQETGNREKEYEVKEKLSKNEEKVKKLKMRLQVLVTCLTQHLTRLDSTLKLAMAPISFYPFKFGEMQRKKSLTFLTKIEKVVQRDK